MPTTDIDLQTLRSLIAIADTGSFSKAAALGSRTQPALSLQIRKLEDRLGRQLLDRSSRGVTLTADGEIYLPYARRILDIHTEAVSRLREPEAEGEIRIGTPEDFATFRLSTILARFRREHPRVQLSVRCDLTLNLLESYKSGELDVVLVKRDPQSVRGGTRVWREQLVFAAPEHWEPRMPVPLIVSPSPCIYRSRAVAALDDAGIAWTVTYMSQSLAGTLAAARAGLGVTVLPADMLPPDVLPLPKSIGLPELADAEIALMSRDGLSAAGQMLVDHITHALEKSPHGTAPV
jgi:DNA-binding transcriptional LysR family regulator